MYKLLSCILATVLLASTFGCASKYGTQQTTVNYYPACYDPIKSLRESEKSVTNQTLGGAAMGAVGGAALGLLATGDVKGAAVGAVAGGAAGAVAGNALAKYKQERDDKRRMAGYLQELESDIKGLDITSASARTSLQCYEKQFRALIQDIKQKRVTRKQAESMFAEIQAGTREAANLLGTAETNGRSLEEQYRNAFAEEERLASSKGRVSKAKATSLKKAQARTRDLQQRVNKISQEKSAAERQAEKQSQELADALASAQA